MKMAVSLNETVLFCGALSISTNTIEFPLLIKSSFGTYNVICGPAVGQYRPNRNPLITINPYSTK